MYVARCDSIIIRSDEVQNMLDQYEERFGERFVAFNYGDFHREGDRCAAQVYRDTLAKALQDSKPYHVESKRYLEFDH